jgi:IS5 family transposase
MLGRQSPQMDLADAVLWTGKERPKPLIEKGSFHDRFAQVRSTILRDEDFEHWFDEEAGRRSIPPSVVAGAFLLALREDCSDRETEQRMRYDLRWKWALGLGLNDHGCDHSSLCVFRARLLAHQEEGKLFQGIVARAVEAGLLPKRAVQVMDSSPMLGAAAVQDTYKLLRTALHKLVKGHKGGLPKEPMPQLKRYLQTGKPDIDWENREARQRELQQLVEDAELALRELPAESDRPVASAARALLEQVAHQDVERDGKGRVQIRQGVAKDRVVSTVDPEMRHGHKSSAGRWDGYKKHVSVEPQTELITAVEVSAANVNDGAAAMKLLEQQAEVGLAPAEVVADHQYAAGELREQAQAQGEGTTIVTKASALPDDGYFHKREFVIDLEAGIVTCPAEQVARIRFRPGHTTDAVFAAATCAACPLVAICVRTPGQGRTVSIHPFEHQLQAAARRREQPDFPALMAQRPGVERKQAHWNQKGGRRSRYYGLHKTRLQALWSAAVVNIERLMVIGQALNGLQPGLVAPAG